MQHHLSLLIVAVKLAAVCCQSFVPDYKLALKYSVLYYEAQRSGKLPPNNRIKWRGDSAVDDHGDDGEDLSGGFYDGTDFVKFSFPLAYSITVLSWGVMKHPDIYKSVDEYESVINVIKWGTDYFIKCHVSPNELYGQVGDFNLDHKYWGRPEEMNLTRPAYKINETHPGSDLAAEVSAALSSASILFRELNASYSQILLNHAIELHNFANIYRGLSKDVFPGAKQFYYEVFFYGDQLIWSALWLYKATNNSMYLQDAEKWYFEYDLQNKTSTFFYFNDQTIGIRLLLAEVTHDTIFSRPVLDFCDYSIDTARKTPKGLVYIKKFGVLALAANIAFICLEASKFDDSRKEKYIEFARSQLDYILGSSGQSYVVGYGDNYPRKPYHSASSCPDLPEPCGWSQYHSPEPNPQIVFGALVSGPKDDDHYIDRREDYYFEYNVVSIDFNAGFQSALAAFIHFDEELSRIRSQDAYLEVLPLDNSTIVR
ncbi:endoglucanase F-like isoform X2 [Rhynchophorus ferrugineus]